MLYIKHYSRTLCTYTFYTHFTGGTLVLRGSVVCPSLSDCLKMKFKLRSV